MDRIFPVDVADSQRHVMICGGQVVKKMNMLDVFSQLAAENFMIVSAILACPKSRCIFKPGTSARETKLVKKLTKCSHL